jgi:hypothetical protein
MPNPTAVLFIATATLIGYLAGSWPWGCLAGCVLVLLAAWSPDPFAPYDALMRHRRRRR